MAKRRYGFDEPKIQRFLKEGRGTGHGADYKPWLTIQDVPSLGRASRVHGFKTGREHHLLSDNETGLFLMLDWSNAVIDIREQFPLERDVTRRIAKELGVTHPVDTESRVDLVMTTDFLIDLRVGNTTHSIARAVKPADKLDDERTIQKLEIERRYWLLKSEPWALVIHRDLPAERIKNLRWLHEMQSLDRLEAPHPDYWPDRCRRLLAALPRAGCMTIGQFIGELEQSGGFESGESLMVIRHLAANRQIGFALDQAFSTQWPITILTQGVIDMHIRETA